MKGAERNVMRLMAVQHLRAAYGIKVKNWNHKTKQTANVCKSTSSTRTVKVFGVQLESLPQYNIEHGGVPRFLVDACMMLLAHVDTEGLFRKSGSIVRLKALRAKLDAGEGCLATAVPCDVAGLVKQFFRELPEPVLPAELHEAFLKAQQLTAEADRTAATMLLSCVLPDRNLGVLRYFFDFLHNVSRRSAENKMDSSNLSLILAPNLLHSGEGTDKMNASTEKRLKLQAAVIHCFIESAQDFGVLPQFLMEKVPAMLGSEASVLSPQDGPQELDSNSGMKRRRRRSLGVFSSATPVIATPNSKRKQTLETGQSFGFSNKKRRSIKKNLGIDLLPNTLFSGTSTPRSACGGSSEVLDSSHNAMSSVGKSSRQSARRKSTRLSNRHAVNRVESGKAGCFSPKVNKKEAPRKTLRSRFSLGKSSKEAGAESIGWRLATQESTTSFLPTKDKDFSPAFLHKGSESKSSKYFSKSEDNLLTPQCDISTLRTSWSDQTPDGVQVFGGGSFTDTPMTRGLKSNYYSSEPAIMVSKPPLGVSLPKTLCCASSAESLESEASVAEMHTRSRQTLLKIKTTVAEAAGDLRSVSQDLDGGRCGENLTKPSESVLMPPPQTPIRQVQSIDTETCAVPTQQRWLAYDQNITFGQIEIAQLSPLHIDSALFDTFCTPFRNGDVSSLCTDVSSLCTVVGSQNATNSVARQTRDAIENMNSSRLIDALDIQSPAHFNLAISAGSQSTPCRPGPELADELSTPHERSVPRSDVDLPTKVSAEAQEQQPPESRDSLKTQRLRVLDHVQRFNQLTIYSPKDSKGRNIRSPLKFQRTPVRQSVRRINSLLGDSRKPSSLRSPVTKSVSLESVISSGARLQLLPPPGPAHSDTVHVIKKLPPPVPPKKPSTLARRPRVTQNTRPCALGDMTNKIQQQSSVLAAGKKKVSVETRVRQVTEKDVSHYRGSPRNPLNQTRLLSATKPIDL